MTEFNKVADGKGELIVTIETETWKKAQEKAFNKLAQKVEIKGFRKGQAPKNMIKQHIPAQSLIYEAIEVVAQEALVKGVEEHHVELIDRPELALEKVDENECVLKFVCPIKPDVTLGQYTDLGYHIDEITVTEEEIDEELKTLKEQKADLEVKEDGTVEKGDSVVMDFEGFLDGVAFEGGKAENYDLEIGSGQFIPGFEDQMIGMKAEEEREINLSFPEDYHVDELKGQAVVFKVKVHEIKTKVLPEIDEEFIADLKLKDVTNMEELREYIRKAHHDHKEMQLVNAATEEVLKKASDNATVNIPEVMINNEIEQMLKGYEQRLMAQGLTLDKYLEFAHQTRDEFKATLRDEAARKVKLNLVFEAIADKENVQVSDEEVAEQLKRMSEMYEMEVEQIKNYISDEQVRHDVRLQKALDIVKGI